jgi:hypothetical protein
MRLGIGSSDWLFAGGECGVGEARRGRSAARASIVVCGLGIQAGGLRCRRRLDDWTTGSDWSALGLRRRRRGLV